MKRILTFIVSVLLVVVFAVHDTALVFADPTAADIKDSLDSLQKKLDQATKKKQALEGNLNQIKSSLSTTVTAIGKTKALLRDTTDTIKRKELEVQLLEENIQLKKEMLTALMQEIYFNADKSVAEVVLGEDDFSGALDEASNVAHLGERVKTVLDEVQGLKGQTESERANLEAMKAKNEQVLAEKAKQQQVLVSDQAEVQADVADQEKIIARLKKELAQLQGDLSTLTGKSYDAKDIREAVEFASKKTGVPEGVLYGFLKKETNLGANTGQCTYDQVKAVSIPGYKKYGKRFQLSIDRLYNREKLFYSLMDSLGYNKSKKISCTIPFAKAGPNQGGAMGVAQFMSDTWGGWDGESGYIPDVRKFTGHSKPDPWNLTDGVMAMALKVKSAGGTSNSASAIRKATINYYGAFSQGYYDVVLYWSKNYKALFQ